MRGPLRLLLLQLLPILIFLVVDATVEDPVWAIGAALGCVAFQAVLIGIRERRFDLFVLLDAGIIGGLGAVSLLTQNELFFKLKPAILEGVMVPFLLFLALASERIVLGYLGRYSAGQTIHPAVVPLLRRMLLAMCLMVLVHASLVLWAALHWSRQAWGWISGPGFYVILVPFVIWAVYRRLRMRRANTSVAAEPEGMQAATRISGRRRRQKRG